MIPPTKYAVLRRTRPDAPWQPWFYAPTERGAADALVRLMATNWCRRVWWQLAKAEAASRPIEADDDTSASRSSPPMGRQRSIRRL